MDYIELEVEKILWHTLCEILGTPLVKTMYTNHALDLLAGSEACSNWSFGVE